MRNGNRTNDLRDDSNRQGLFVNRARQGAVVAACLFALTSVLAVFLLDPIASKDGLSRAKEDAEARMERAMELFRHDSRSTSMPAQATVPDCAVLGRLLSPITSKVGLLSAKEATCNPRFASLLVEWFHEAGLRPGDSIGVALSGSFPALNIATIVAAESYGLRPIVISSLSSSMFGANRPGMTWIDMESALVSSGVIETRSIAVTLGGKDDNGWGLPEDGVALLRDAVERHGVPLIETESLNHAIETRLSLYRRWAGSRGMQAYVNVGGGRASVGISSTKHKFQPGLNTKAPEDIDKSGVMPILSKAGLPVIHLGNIRKLCSRHDLHCPTFDEDRSA